MGRLDPLEHFEAVHAGHLDVQKHQIGRIALDQREAFGAGGRADELIALVFERPPHRIAIAGLVINDKNAGFHLRRIDANGSNGALIEAGNIDVDGQDIAWARSLRQPVVGVGRRDRPSIDFQHDVVALNARRPRRR